MSANQRAPSLSLRVHAPSSACEDPVPELYIDGPQLEVLVVVVG